MEVLEKGLSFSPSTNFDLFQTILDLNRFTRNLTLRRHFDQLEEQEETRNGHLEANMERSPVGPSWEDSLNKEEPGTSEYSNRGLCSEDKPELLFSEHVAIRELKSLGQEEDFRDFAVSPPKNLPAQNRDFYPVNSRGNVIEVFHETVEQELIALSQTVNNRVRHNLSKAEREALVALQSNPAIIIRNADKGGMTVVLNKVDYQQEAVRQLSDSQTYQRLRKDPTNTFKEILFKLVEEGVYLGLIPEKIAMCLKVESPVSPIFHHLPKIHKGEVPPKGRPIVAGIGGLNEKMGQWLDAYLQPIVNNLPAVLRDSKHVLRVMDQMKWPENGIWCTMDVSSLYSSIPHFLALMALEFQLSNMSKYTEDLIMYLSEVTNYLLTHNFFQFDQEFFLQKLGASMGAPFSPSIANIFMSWWEEVYVYSTINPFKQNIKWYGRYIDDLLLIWTGGRQALDEFIIYCNNNPFNLRFTSSCHENTIDFLDLTLTSDSTTGEIQTRTFRKPVAGNNTLRASSCHPPHVFRAIPIGEMIRTRRNCSREDQFELEIKVVNDRLEERGYQKNTLQKAQDIARGRKRRDLLYGKKRCMDTPISKQVVFSTAYSLQFQKIRSIVTRNLNILKADPKLTSVVATGCKVVSKRAPTVGQKLSPSLFSSNSDTKRTWLTLSGFFGCNTPKCITCGVAQHGAGFKSETTGKEYKIKQYINCDTKSVVYLVTCQMCKVQYVGCTMRKLRNRIAEHVLGIKNPTSSKISNVAKHFIECHQRDYSGLKVQAIERVCLGVRGGDLYKKLIRQETKWIFNLNTRQPKGLNFKWDVALCI